MNKLEAITFCIENEQGFAQRLNSKTVTVEQFIQVISQDSYNLKQLGLSAQGTSKLIKRCFPNKTNKDSKACAYLLNKYSLKYCNSCKTTYTLDQFYKHSATWDKVAAFCKECMDGYTHPTAAERVSKRRAAKLNAVPKWADLEAIKKVYEECPEGCHVDHEIPLQGINVCGLHVEYNLQYLTIAENLSKSNKLLC